VLVGQSKGVKERALGLDKMLLISAIASAKSGQLFPTDIWFKRSLPSMTKVNDEGDAERRNLCGKRPDEKTRALRLNHMPVLLGQELVV
jgi:hypothetical protein